MYRLAHFLPTVRLLVFFLLGLSGLLACGAAMIVHVLWKAGEKLDDRMHNEPILSPRE
jgi:hypothetical protein